MALIMKYPNGESIEEINGVRVWVAYKRRWFFKAFGTREDYTGLNVSSYQEAVSNHCTAVIFRLLNEKNSKMIGQWKADIESFERGVPHTQKGTGILTINIPVRSMSKL